MHITSRSNALFELILVFVTDDYKFLSICQPPLASANLSTSADLVLSPSLSGLVSFSFASNLVFSSFNDTVLPVIQDMTKPFYIRKPAISADNTTIPMFTKDTLCIGGIFFTNLDET